ncbi:triose-phosphate isomerase [Entomospira entomophila]|uniref:Triosephosphate isomerase n=1 Tax=Entomospira entomophila TaxID=2719988 RepID=A0A968KRF4_9SPIO|nr:triose-phosphate isomerase [Entomospira entomophilus]NIZ40693.1 triose-phosphate isomerase [Entomospira entomophilus]WDI34906.1 triose-phosphate isomerase [Entomospira entomophilus]
MRKTLIAGNWKMNKTPSEATALINALLPLVKDSANDIIVAPNFVSLPAVASLTKGSNIKVAAQNMACIEAGAVTGETSVLMLKDIGVSAVILGHSERRQLFQETNELINKKIALALQHNLLAIYCVGETLEERESGKFLSIIENQVKEGLKDISTEALANVVIAYEPVWAIGTGKVATGEQAEEVHAYIRGVLSAMYSPAVAEKVIIQYGGSVNPENVKELMGKPNIDGALVGGASLKPDSFAALVNYNK